MSISGDIWPSPNMVLEGIRMKLIPYSKAEAMKDENEERVRLQGSTYIGV